MPNALVWFRNDLRLADNPALRMALEEGFTPICVHVHAPEEEGRWAPGAASEAWRHHSLLALDASLRARGSRLRMFAGPSLPTLQSLAAACDAQAVFWNRRYEPAVEQRDTRIKQALRAQGLRVQSDNAALLFEPWEIRTRQGGPYKVFTPFHRALQALPSRHDTWDPPDALRDADDGPDGLPVDALRLLPSRRWDAGFWAYWTPGEAGALETLETFVDGALRGYIAGRERPDQVGTSRLSPHLHFGEISPWRVLQVLDDARSAANGADADAFARQLAWREFAHHLLHHFPGSSDENFNPRFDAFPWARTAPTLLEAWQRGRTGVPIVDAGMRELWETGWMHNRVRMVVGSWLCKHMRMHWREGARWFWDTLVDADLANNSLGWQWIGGTGADASPYFRVFNPVTQAQKFDPDGEYIARWLPELAPLPAPARIAPWTEPALLKRIAPRYPMRPLVDLAAGRQAALDAYAQTR